MPQKFDSTVATGTSLTADNVYLKRVTLTPAAAAATIKIYANGVEKFRLQAAANGSSFEWEAKGRHNSYHIDGPVTYDLAGTGAAVMIEW